MYLERIWFSRSFWCQNSEKCALIGSEFGICPDFVSVEQPLALYSTGMCSDNSTC